MSCHIYTQKRKRYLFGIDISATKTGRRNKLWLCSIAKTLQDHAAVQLQIQPNKNKKSMQKYSSSLK